MRFLMLTLLLAGCAQGGSSGGSAGSCASSVVLGTWDADASSDVMVFKADCTGTSSGCGSTFTYPPATATFGTATITVTSTSGGGGCLPLGATDCDYQISGALMQFDCGGGVLNYTKQ